MKKYIKELLFFCQDIDKLKYIVYLDVEKAKRWVENGANVASNQMFLSEQGNPAIEALEKVQNLEQLFDLLKD